MVEIPLPTDGAPLVTWTITVDDKPLTMLLDWSERAGRWLFSVVGISENQRVLPNGFPLERSHAREGCPEGELVWLCTAVPGRYDLGTVARLYYWTAEELAAMLAA